MRHTVIYRVNFFYGYDRLFSFTQLPENYFFRHYYPTRGRLRRNRYQLPLQQEDARQNTLVMTSQDYFGLLAYFCQNFYLSEMIALGYLHYLTREMVLCSLEKDILI